MKKNLQSIDSKVIKRIRGHGRGWVFTANHFKDLGSSNGVALALKRYASAGLIRRLSRGLYDYPRQHEQLGQLEPTTEDVAKALAGNDAIRLQPSGAYAANLLGLSQQIPMKTVFLTDGRSRRAQVGEREIILRKTTPRNMATAGRVSGLVVQALRHIGQAYVDSDTVKTLRQRLSVEDRKRLLNDLKFAPNWVADIMRQVAGEM
jgi:hypothetical protein